MAGRPSAAPDQLALDLGPVAAPLLPRRIGAMLPGAGPGPFDDDGWFFEPWWPGEPAALSVEGDRIRLSHGHLGDALAAFPELAAIRGQLAADIVELAGTLLVLDAEGRPDHALLRRRLRDPESREGVGAFVGSDLLHVDGRPMMAWPFAQRRARLLEIMTDSDRCVVSRGLRGEGRTLATAVASMGLRDISARLLAARWRAGVAPDAWLKLPVQTPTARETRPLLVLLQRLPLEA